MRSWSRKSFTAASWCGWLKSASLASVACMYMCGVTVAEPRPLPNNLTDEDIEAAAEALISEAAPGEECKNRGEPKKTLKGKGCGQYTNNKTACAASAAKFDVSQECEGCSSGSLKTEGSAKCIFIPDQSQLPGSSHLGTCAQNSKITFDRSKLDCAKKGNSQGVE